MRPTPSAPSFRHASSRVFVILIGLAIASSGCRTTAPSGDAAAIRTETSNLDVNGTTLFVKRLGEGVPVLVIHGGPVLDHGYLLPHFEPLARDHELIFFDQRLAGRSAGRVDPESLTFETLVEDIEAIRRELDLGRVHIVGHSFGGLLAMMYAIRHQEHLRSLVLLNTMPASSTMWQREQEALGELRTESLDNERQAILDSEAFAAGDPAAVAELLRNSFKPTFHDPELVDRLELYIPEDYAARSEQLGALMPELSSFDLHDALESVNLPVLLLYGTDEPGARFGGGELSLRFPQSLFVEIARCGHFPFVERPRSFTSLVNDFLRGHDE